ncbi:MAG TPA: carnitine dehydratase [Spongiibacteraceae bacterium]|nr:carnitine dehydratase [Spongiibacteraceae bacterium]HCS26980.1 carnitine dehydratase [Spongiibacteraceae bacterium]|tara:strand:- start:1214 stop:2362 length:1149 start_codon:yes stop_codon:yes gene_type:complete
MGPLSGIRIVEIAGIGPGPFAAMLLADMGAEVIRVERPGGNMFSGDLTDLDLLNRGKRCLCADLKTEGGIDVVKRLLKSADAVLEGFRPGVMEKLGLGPDECLALNEKLVIGRMTGWGREGPLAMRAGHDINYIAVAGALHPIGRAGEKPVIPLNLVGDFGGGGMLLAYGMVCALLEARISGKGQVVDAAMVDGAALLMTSIFSASQTDFWSEERGTNMLDSGAPFYEVYETSDGKYMAVGAIESQFYQVFVERLGIGDQLPNQYDVEQWPAMKEQIQAAFMAKTRDQWTAIFEDSDACVTPVLAMREAKDHPHNRARASFVERNGIWQPRTAPRFSRTDGGEPGSAVPIGYDTRSILAELNYTESEQRDLLAAAAVVAIEE